MNTKSERDNIKSQILATQEMIRQMAFHPYVSKSLKAKEKELQETLSKMEGPNVKAQVVLSFFGKPVYGTRGIDPNFVGKVLPHYQKIVASHFLSNTKTLKGVANKSKFANLLVTAVAKGSFGFVMEKAQNNNLFDEQEYAEILDEVTNVIESSIKGDEEFAEKLSNVSIKEIKSLGAFLKNISENKAGVLIDSGSRALEVTNEDATIAYNRVAATDMEEVPVTYRGQLRGLLLESWKFEFSREDGTIIHGDLDEEMTEEQAVEYFSKINHEVTAEFQESTVSFKKGKPQKTFVLMRIL